MRLSALLVTTLLAACAQTPPPEPIVRTVTVQVPYDDPACAREARDRLRQEAVAYPDTDDALGRAASVFEGVQLLRAGRVLRIAREIALLAAIEACASPAP
ncbi:MAG: hypothetical protein V4527_18345 [Pseudomonadota bacterium]